MTSTHWQLILPSYLKLFSVFLDSWKWPGVKTTLVHPDLPLCFVMDMNLIALGLTDKSPDVRFVDKNMWIQPL